MYCIDIYLNMIYFQHLISIEHQFSQMQSSKVLDLLQHNKDVNKETNVTAYYLIKTELYNDLANFLNFVLNTMILS